jgi:hypothetical protein
VCQWSWSTAISSTSSTIRRLSFAFLIRMKALVERESVRRGEKVGHLGRGRRRFRRHAGRAFEEERRWDLQMWEICCNRLAPMRFLPFSYFWTCGKASPVYPGCQL